MSIRLGGTRVPYQPLEDLLPQSNYSIYRLVRLASMRAVELSEKGSKLVAAPAEQKVTTTALEEIKQGKVIDKIVADALAEAPKKSK